MTKKLAEPLIVSINPDDQRISWDPRVIDSEAMKSFMRKALEDKMDARNEPSKKPRLWLLIEHEWLWLLSVVARKRAHSRDKPRPLCFAYLPIRKSLPTCHAICALQLGARHPVPIALGEMRKLCVSRANRQGVGHRELVGLTCRVAVSGLGSEQILPPLATGSNMFLPESREGLLTERVPVLTGNSPFGIQISNVLSPGVVIRRRPQRPNPTGLPCLIHCTDRELDEVGF